MSIALGNLHLSASYSMGCFDLLDLCFAEVNFIFRNFFSCHHFNSASKKYDVGKILVEDTQSGAL